MEIHRIDVILCIVYLKCSDTMRSKVGIIAWLVCLPLMASSYGGEVKMLLSQLDSLIGQKEVFVEMKQT